MNPVRYPHPSEKTDVIKPVPEDQVEADLERLKATLADHLGKRPHWSDLNARAAWALKKDQLEKDITLLRRQRDCRWRPVEGRTA